MGNPAPIVYPVNVAAWLFHCIAEMRYRRAFKDRIYAGDGIICVAVDGTRLDYVDHETDPISIVMHPQTWCKILRETGGSGMVDLRLNSYRWQFMGLEVRISAHHPTNKIATITDDRGNKYFLEFSDEKPGSAYPGRQESASR